MAWWQSEGENAAARCLQELDLAEPHGPATVPWWRPMAWWNEQVERAALTDGEWDALAIEEISRIANRVWHREGIPGNPFHPRTLEHVDLLMAEVADRIPGTELDLAYLIEDLPQLRQRLTPERVPDLVRAGIAHRQRIAADPVLLTQDVPVLRHMAEPDPHRRTLVVQHQASGLRARFEYGGSLGEFGRIMSKPYSIDSIDPDRPEDPMHRAAHWHRYTGLGIGTKIYLKAADLLPDIRWDGSGMSLYAVALRRKLHATDPWRWISRLCECTWKDLTRDTAAQIPHVQAPAPR